MPNALHTALDGIIDYAGLFPPARLPLHAATAEYLRHRRSPESWIVSRFVAPASQLEELGDQLSSLDVQVRLPLTVIGRSGHDLNSFRAGLEEDAKAMAAFEESSSQLAAIEAFEVRLPTYSILSQAVRDLQAFDDVDVYLELPWGADQQEALAEIADTGWLSAKFRTGGTEAKQFPIPAQLALVLKTALDLDLTIKLTAGLHHPYPIVDPATGAKMHGFLNVLGACALHLANDLSLDEFEGVLAEDRNEAFQWSPGGLLFGDWECSAEDFEDVRQALVGFGSCSVGEPMADLRALGLVE